VLSPALRWLSKHLLRLLGWTLTGRMPANTPKSVVIAAPHTSNWDFPYTLMVAFAMGLNIQWMGKKQLFRWPFRHLMRWLGGIPVSSRSIAIDQFGGRFCQYFAGQPS
jgi:1-acyl-sn-glycerol-3-phosphate acyltransferase